ncbi:uncharacterized protein A4U43_C09F16690 [Asparagus officinalis]|uniref:ZZ-type domain-containing protein n=2 Tax=Asparagus officinalis TaxID=4686 RepID=A0A5P1E7Y0_ASPOF|nr:uncharacterized protein A4U43_C09F16690 [Asparagus officinalis]
MQSPVEAHASFPSQTGFSSHIEVPVSRETGSPPTDVFPKLGQGMVSHSYRRSYANNENIPRTFHKGVQCDGCGMHPIVGPRFKSNVKDDYDLCNICFAQMGNETEYTRIDHASRRAPRLLKPGILKDFHNHHSKCRFPSVNVLRASGARPSRAKLESRFVQDVTVLDGTVMPPSTRFTKIWRLHNNGTLAWPFGTQLVWVGGDQFGDRVSSTLEIPANGFPVDKELDIAVDFTAPSRPGRYVSYWRMASLSGQQFGQRVWVLIQVDYSSPNSAAGSNVQPAFNLNLPPDSISQNLIIDVNAEPLDSGLPEPSVTTTTEEPVKPVAESVIVGEAVQVVGGLLDAGNVEHHQSTPAAAVPPVASYPLINLQEMLPMVDEFPVTESAATADGNPVEQTLLKELEDMGFKEINLNKEILRLNEYNLEQSVDDLCGFAEWDPLLCELQEMGFNNREMNKKALIKNGGSIKRAVLDLIAGQISE